MWTKRPNPDLVQQPLAWFVPCHCSPSSALGSPRPQHTQLTLIEGTELLKLSCFREQREGQELGREAGTAPQALPAAGFALWRCTWLLSCMHQHGASRVSTVPEEGQGGARTPFLCLFREAQLKLLHYKTTLPWLWTEHKSLWKHHCHSHKCTKYCLEISIILLRYGAFFPFSLISVFWFTFTAWKEELQSVSSVLERKKLEWIKK